jgi:hypothetical protein
MSTRGDLAAIVVPATPPPDGHPLLLTTINLDSNLTDFTQVSLVQIAMSTKSFKALQPIVIPATR